jgi:hypothetical protein
VTRTALGSARFWKRLHLALFAVWVLLLPPTILWWKDSIPYLVGMSWYAIAIGHISSWQAARAERKEEKG